MANILKKSWKDGKKKQKDNITSWDEKKRNALRAKTGKQDRKQTLADRKAKKIEYIKKIKEIQNQKL